ncbi:MAG: hypothetical protein U1E38_02030 [Rhodospirillales bacterium]
MLAHLIERGELRDPVLAVTPVTVTEVRISPDLRQARVYVMPLGGDARTRSSGRWSAPAAICGIESPAPCT